MKITKTSSGKTQIKLSRTEWESIGKKAGWDDETWQSEEARLLQRQCGNCEKFDCDGTCTLPEMQGGLEYYYRLDERIGSNAISQFEAKKELELLGLRNYDDLVALIEKTEHEVAELEAKKQAKKDMEKVDSIDTIDFGNLNK